MNTTLISNIKATRKAIVCNIGFIITLKGILCIEILKGIFYMFKEAIYHRPKDNYAYAYDEQTIHIRVRTREMIFKAPILFTVILTNGKTEMDISKYTHEKTGSTALFDYWCISIEPKFKRLRYGFELKSETDTLIYAERGFFSSIPNDDVGNFFCFPFIHADDVFKAPSWIKDTIWYQIFPERFANGDSTLNPENTLPWGSANPTPTNFSAEIFLVLFKTLITLLSLAFPEYISHLFSKLIQTINMTQLTIWKLTHNLGRKKLLKSSLKNVISTV